MKSAYSLVGFLLLVAVQGSWQVPNAEDNVSRLPEDAVFSPSREAANSKRHSEGTFSNDYSKYLETRRAQDFVQWLKNTKRNGDVSSYLQDKAAKEFVSWLKTGRGRRE
ncbi:hypothetical protein CRUP_008411 [Coryphaenoides rupestris]|nr:hypothetical protein CRUP_008411 [Coryphaenoides rupestris]